jgi:hypothetical protein
MSDLRNTKVGDTLIVSSGWGHSTIHTVTRTTKTRVFCDSLALNRSGREIGAGKWNGCYAQPSTPEEIAEIQEGQKRRHCIQRIQTAFHRMNLREMPTSQLVAILEQLGGSDDPTS